MKSSIFKTVFCILIINTACVYSQNKVQGEQGAIKQAILNSNDISTVVFNYGSIGKPNYMANRADFFWDSDSLGYMFEFGPIVAAQVVDSSGDTLHITDDSFILPNQGTYSPDGTQKWGWLPDSGYENSNQNYLATKNNPSSWPSNWSSWPEFPGDSLINPLDEAYYVMDDYSNAKFPYYPFPGDTTKRGLGLKAEVHIYQFGSQSFKDALIIRYKITNESPEDLNKVYFGFQGDPHIGGYQDFSDDLINIYLNHDLHDLNSSANNTIYKWDSNGIGMFGKHPGYIGFKLLDTPDGLGLTSFHTAQYTNSMPNVPKNSTLMWDWLSGGIDSTSVLNKQPGDNIINFGTGPFSLKSGESKYLTLAIFLSHDYYSMVQNAVYIYINRNWPYITSNPGDESGNDNYKINLTAPTSGEISGNTNITWNYSGNDVNAKAVIEYSSDMGKDWYVLASGINASGNSYQWNTVNNKDGVNYLLRIIAYNSSDMRQNYYSIGGGKFTVNNPGDAQPELQQTQFLKDTSLTDGTFDISWLAEDADNQNLNITLSYSLNRNSNFTAINSGNYATGINNYKWDYRDIPNSDGYYLKINASDGVKDSSIIEGPFSLNYAERSYITTNIFHEKGNATPQFYIQVTDTSKLTKDTYRLTFNADDSNAKTMDITDFNTKEKIISNYPVINGLSTPSFNGIKLTVHDYATGINYNKTGFNRSELDSDYTVSFPPQAGYPQIELPYDWDIIFNDMDTNSAGMYINPMDTIITTYGTQIRVIVPFYLFDKTYQEKAIAFASIFSKIQNLSPWKPSYAIILQPHNATGAESSYQINFNFHSGVLPGKGDTLHIVTYKTITSEDVFRFAVDSNNVITGVKINKIPKDYRLFQNYPNPFNPTTKIKYSIPKTGYVTIKVYDILGKEVTTLVNEEKTAGKYIVNFNGDNLASGIYFYQLRATPISGQAENFISTKKMLLLK